MHNIKLIIAKPIFHLFLLFAFLAGLYFYVFNSKTPYMEYLENMNMVEATNMPTSAVTMTPMPIGATAGPGVPRQTDAVVGDASRDNGYNTNMYPGFDPDGQYNGVYTNLDYVHDSTSFSQLSENPMDDNWGGVLYTKQAVDSGKYDDNLVIPYSYNKEMGTGISTRKESKASKSVFA
jgi:hypothetical protein